MNIVIIFTVLAALILANDHLAKDRFFRRPAWYYCTKWIVLGVWGIGCLPYTVGTLCPISDNTYLLCHSRFMLTYTLGLAISALSVFIFIILRWGGEIMWDAAKEAANKEPNNKDTPS